MILFKWCGAALLLFWGGLLGHCAVRYEREKYRQIDGYVRLLRHIRREIDCFSSPITKILANIDRELLCSCGVIDVPSDLVLLLKGATLYLPEGVSRLLFEFAARLGGGYREEEVRCCDYYLAQLTPVLEQARAELAKRERVARFLPPMLALAVILLFL